MIRARIISHLIAALVLAQPALAGPPKQSLRTVLRAGEPVAVTPSRGTPAAGNLTEAAAQPAGIAQENPASGLQTALRPNLRPAKLQLFANKKKRQLRKGAVCGDLALQGEPVGAVPGRIRGCGVKDAIRLRSVSGIPLSQKSLMDCTTAKALKSWVDKGLKPAVGSRGGGVSRIRVAAHYACRTRNNQKGAKISEHGRGRAIDIAGFSLADGSDVTVLGDWGKGWKGKALKAMHRLACGPFGTVLGPNANRFHRDHFHFDTARYRSGSYCK